MIRKEASKILKNDLVARVDGDKVFMDAFWKAVDELDRNVCKELVAAFEEFARIYSNKADTTEDPVEMPYYKGVAMGFTHAVMFMKDNYEEDLK